MQLYQPTITGSLSVSGSINLSGSITLAGGGTISGTASIATTASYAVSASNAVVAQTASFVALAQSASNAIAAATASSSDNFLVRNTLTAQTLVVQTITSSVDFVTGSTRFGSIIDNTHQFTGSVGISGSLNGTSATFTSSGRALTLSNSGDVYLQVARSGSFVNIGIDGTSTFYNTNSSHKFYTQDGNVNALTIATGGAATFVGSATFGSDVFTYNNGGIFFSGGGSYTSGIFQNGAGLNLQTGTTPRLIVQTNGNIQIDNGQLNTPKTLYFNANSSTGGSYGKIQWYNVQWDGNTRGEIVVEDDGALANGRMIFKTGASGANAAERMRIASTGNITCTNNSVKRATLTKYAGVNASSTSNISFNVSSELGVPGAGYIMVEMSAIGYGGAGSNGMIYKSIVGGYSGHTLNSNYHKYSEYVSAITNGSVSIYNPTADVYGITVTNNAGNGMNIILKLDVTWYG